MTIRCRLPVVLGFILAMVAARAVADEPDQDVTGEIVAYGLYDSDTLGAAPTTDESSGGVHLLGTPLEHLRTTHKIPCRVNVHFGFTVELSGLQPGQQHTVRTVTTHPPILQPDGRTLRKSTSDQVVTAPAANVRLVTCWGFATGYEYELVKGRWTKSVLLDGKPIAEMSFDVVDPNTAEQPEAEDPEP